MDNRQSLTMLEAGEVPERYLRNIGTVGINGQIRLLRSKVVVVGAGGLGGTVIELLARQGVGFIRVVDGDSFAGHNLNRQLLANENNIGSFKAMEAKIRVGIINFDVVVDPVVDRFESHNAEQLLNGMDVAVDALDNVESRLLLSKAAQRAGIPLVHGAIAGFSGQIMTVLPNSKGLETIYSDNTEKNGVEKGLGNPPATPALVAALQVQEVVKLITGNGEVLVNRLLQVNAEYNCYDVIELQ